ncbi:hypothetical protein MTO96_036455 [Rhipicephalus appendiculatus]
MTDAPFDTVQRFNIRGVVRTSKARSSLNIKKASHCASCVCCLSCSAAVIVTAVSLGVYLSNHGGEKRDTSDLGVPFFCPEEAQELAGYVNTSLNPCEDFFAYVCSNAIHDGHRRGSDVDTELVHIAITGVTPGSKKKRGRTGPLLTAFYRTCVETAPHRQLFASTMATALARRTWGHLGVPNTRNALVYIVTASVKYDLPSAVCVAFERDKSTMLLRIATTCTTEGPAGLYWAALRASREALRAHGNWTASTADAADVEHLHTKLCERFANVSKVTATYTLTNESDAFNSEVWNVGDLRTALNVIGHSPQSAEHVVVEGVGGIRLLHDMFASDEGAVDVKAAYLVRESVATAVERFYARNDSSAQGVVDKCVEGLFRVPRVWHAFAAEVFTSLEKDADARATFEVIKDAVLLDCQRSSLFEADDAEGLRRFFDDLVLVTPAEADETRVAIPEPTDTYAENFLALQACEFQMADLSELGHSDDPLPGQDLRIVDDRRLLMTPSLYAQIRASCSPDHDIGNVLRLGSTYAEGIWYAILHSVRWSAKTRANIDRFKACLAQHYFGDADCGPEVDQLTVTALGMVSVANALRSPDWNVLRPVWGLWRLSRGQFVYTLSSYYRCPKSRSSRSARLINAPLTYVPDFGEAFGCASTSPMTKPRRCPMQN